MAAGALVEEDLLARLGNPRAGPDDAGQPGDLCLELSRCGRSDGTEVTDRQVVDPRISEQKKLLDDLAGDGAGIDRVSPTDR